MKNIIFITIVSFITISYAQTNINTSENPVLLIRLNTNNHLINYYLSKDNVIQAQIEKEKQNKYNQKIIQAFQDYYSLSLIYFFYSNESNHIKEGILENIFNTEGAQITQEEIKTIKETNYQIGYFGTTNGNLKFHAFILNNEKIIQLEAPNTSFIRTYRSFGPFKRKLPKVISILEKKMNFSKLRK